MEDKLASSLGKWRRPWICHLIVMSLLFLLVIMLPNRYLTFLLSLLLPSDGNFFAAFPPPLSNFELIQESFYVSAPLFVVVVFLLESDKHCLEFIYLCVGEVVVS